MTSEQNPSSADKGEQSALPFRVGDRFQSTIDFTTEGIRQVAAAIGDNNPLHHVEELAGRSRFGGLIASGGHSISMLFGVVAQHVSPLTHSLGLGGSFTWRRPVKAGSMMIGEWTVTSLEHSPSLNGYVMGLQGELRQLDGAVAVSANLEILLVSEKVLFPNS